jgi:hypothetical protein
MNLLYSKAIPRKPQAPPGDMRMGKYIPPPGLWERNTDGIVGTHRMRRNCYAR